MGIFAEDTKGLKRTLGMHWQQHQHERYVGPAYDPSRDLSPNLPACDAANSSFVSTATIAPSSMGSGRNPNDLTPTSIPNNCSSVSSISSSSSSSSSTCTTPNVHNINNNNPSINNNNTCRIGQFEHFHVPKIEPPGTPPPSTPSSGPPGGGLGGSFCGRMCGASSVDCDNKVQLHLCAGCGQRITDRFYLEAVDQIWHAACLQCSECRHTLDGEGTCFSRDGNIYCKKDYYRLFGMKRCSRCQAAILSSELVMRARELVFHVHCFTCAVCNGPLTKGDHFGMRDSSVLCRMHYEISLNDPPKHHPPPHQSPFPAPHPNLMLLPLPPHGMYHSSPFPSPDYQPNVSSPSHHHHMSHIPPSPQSGGPPGTPGHCMTPTPGTQSSVLLDCSNNKVPSSFYNGVPQQPQTTTPRQKGRPRKRKPKDLEAMTANLDINADYLDMSFGRSPGTPGMHHHGSSQRTKRMRTSFKHHQLRTMKSYFSINHNPDAKDLKQLSQKTGLPKRVLQVWFQNARAKWRRLVQKQDGKSSGDKCSGSESGMGDLDLYPHGPGSLTGSIQSLPPHSPPFMMGPGGSPNSLDCA